MNAPAHNAAGRALFAAAGRGVIAAAVACAAGVGPAAPLSAQQAPADLVLINAKVYTANDARPTASALAVRAGHIIYVGTDGGALALKGPATQTVDAGGRTVIPGMTDAHAHLLGLAEALRQVDLNGTATYEEVIARVVAKAKSARPGVWLGGRGWDQNDWPVKNFPTHDALSRAIPDNPVVLGRVDGHALLANAAAMKAAGVTRDTKDPTGGRIERDASGEPTGVFVDNAQGLIRRAVPPTPPDEVREALLAAIAELNRWGLTGIADAGVSRRGIELYESLARDGKYSLRNYVMIADDSAALEYYFARGPQSSLYDGHLWLRAVKLYMDGALGSRGAALLEPYSDDPGNRGLLISPPEHIRAVSTLALRRGFQVCTHAIGDRGNRLVLDAYEAALREVPVKDHRFRIEHAQIVDPADIPRFARLGVIPSMQASHQTSDMYWAKDRLGEKRLAGAYAWRSFLSTGVIVPNGSDFPVEMVNPLISFHSAVTRQDAKNYPAGGWRPGEKMTRNEALKSMTLWPAMAAFQETELGSLELGKYADFVLLDQDIMTVPEHDLLKTRVLGTWIGGVRVYDAGLVP